MPMYDWRCIVCGDEHEMSTPMDQCRQECPSCGAECHRLVSAPGFILKGAGFHSTDYPSERRPS